MPGLNMQMGLGSSAGYQGPLYSASATEVPTSAGYPDAGYAQMAFGTQGVQGGGSKPQAHATAFGVFCFVALLVYWWTLPR